MSIVMNSGPKLWLTQERERAWQ